MKTTILTLLSLFVACGQLRPDEAPGNIIHTNDMYRQAKRISYETPPFGLFLNSDSTEAVFIPRHFAKDQTVRRYYLIDSVFVYIP